MLFFNCLASLVLDNGLEIAQNKEKVVLNMEKGIAISSKSITFCIRFNLEGSLKKPHYLFSTYTDQKFELILRVQEFIGFVEITNQTFVFPIPKRTIEQYSWYHFCFTADQTNYQVIVEGKSRVGILPVGIKPKIYHGMFLEGWNTFHKFNNIFHIYLKKAHLAAIFCTVLICS